MSARARLLGAMLATSLATLLGVFAAWPIYQTWWLVVTAAAGLLLGSGIAAIAALSPRPWGGLVTVAVLFGGFVLTVVPVAVPQSFERLPDGLLHGLLDGVAGIVLGWKQLLTLTLPVGSYQAVLVPAYLVFLLSAFCTVTIALRSPRFAPFAALPLVAPVAFGTVFGASALSTGFALPVPVIAPRELGLWAGAVGVGAIWIWFSAGAERRAALRRGRSPGERSATVGRATRVLVAAGTVLVALIAGVMLTPLLDNGGRQVPRDSVDPKIVLREQPSALAAYRVWKRDSTLDAEMFSVASEGALPERLRLAVLDDYDGVDFQVGAEAIDRFTRFPSGESIDTALTVTVTIGDSYTDIWVPTAKLGSVPAFSGPRAAELSDAFYVNRNTGAAIAVPGGSESSGLAQGDGFTASMEGAASPQLSGAPVSGGTSIDLEAMPELAAWVKAQDQPASAEGLLELIDRLRARGYLSHSISEQEGERLWLERLSAQYGTHFESSAGGHSIARIEQLFSQLNAQQQRAGEDAKSQQLVSGIGDDEQFAAAAALVARALGFESRVVTGVRLGDEQAGVPGVPACSESCTGENLAAWIEVRGEQGQWVPIDVTPQAELPPVSLEEGEQLPEHATTPEERDAEEVDPPLGLGERADADETDDDRDSASWLFPLLRAIGMGLLALLLCALLLLFLPLAKRRREKLRRGESDPEVRALSAWQQMIESAEDAGVALSESASPAEVAEALDTAPARWAAAAVEKAVFSAGGVTPQEADWMWAAVDADRAAREANMTRGQKLRASYALRSYGVRIALSRGSAGESAAEPQGDTTLARS